VGFREPPILAQFVAMFHGPFQHEGEGAAAQFSLTDLQCVDVDLRRVVAVVDVEVRRRMIVELHPNRNAVELADCRHASSGRDSSIVPTGRR